MPIEDIRKEIKKYPEGILQIDLARNLGYVNKRNKCSTSYYKSLMSLLKSKEIIRKKAKNGGHIIFLNENKESDKT